MRWGPPAIEGPQPTCRGAQPPLQGRLRGRGASSPDLSEFQYNENAHCPVIATEDIYAPSLKTGIKNTPNLNMPFSLIKYCMLISHQSV